MVIIIISMHVSIYQYIFNYHYLIKFLILLFVLQPVQGHDAEHAGRQQPGALPAPRHDQPHPYRPRAPAHAENQESGELSSVINYCYYCNYFGAGTSDICVLFSLYPTAEEVFT